MSTTSLGNHPADDGTAATLQAFWDDAGRGPSSEDPVALSLRQAQDTWSDLSGMEGNFLGLIDAEGRTIQFYFTSSIPDGVDDARHLQIVSLDFPVPEQGGSYARQVAIGEVHALMAQAFRTGADHAAFAGLAFVPWH